MSGDAEHLAFAESSFDVVLASEVVEHLWNPHGFFDEAFRVLTADGWLIVETPEGKDSLRYDSHKNWFTVEVVKQMVGKRFSVKASQTAGARTGCTNIHDYPAPAQEQRQRLSTVVRFFL